jgi:hypothetical protein
VNGEPHPAAHGYAVDESDVGDSEGSDLESIFMKFLILNCKGQIKRNVDF